MAKPSYIWEVWAGMNLTPGGVMVIINPNHGSRPGNYLLICILN